LWNGVGGLVGVYHPIQSPYNVRQYDDKFWKEIPYPEYLSLLLTISDGRTVQKHPDSGLQDVHCLRRNLHCWCKLMSCIISYCVWHHLHVLHVYIVFFTMYVASKLYYNVSFHWNLEVL
jgi:hypothetical protein